MIIGDKIYVVDTGNRARCRVEGRYCTITKIGRKYFTININGMEKQFTLDDWNQKTDYSADYKLYINEDEYLDEVETDQLIHDIRSAFDFWRRDNNFTLDQLRKVYSILELKNPESEETGS